MMQKKAKGRLQIVAVEYDGPEPAPFIEQLRAFFNHGLAAQRAVDELGAGAPKTVSSEEGGKPLEKALPKRSRRNRSI